jgi:hypothetical protein
MLLWLLQFGQYLPEAACGLYLSERVLGARALCRLLLLQLFNQLDIKISEEAAGGCAGTCSSARELGITVKVGMAQSAEADTMSAGDMCGPFNRLVLPNNMVVCADALAGPLTAATASQD